MERLLVNSCFIMGYSPSVWHGYNCYVCLCTNCLFLQRPFLFISSKRKDSDLFNTPSAGSHSTHTGSYVIHLWTPYFSCVTLRSAEHKMASVNEEHGSITFSGYMQPNKYFVCSFWSTLHVEQWYPVYSSASLHSINVVFFLWKISGWFSFFFLPLAQFIICK